MQDLEDMLGFRPYSFYYYMWRYVSPAILLLLTAASVVEMVVSPAGYNAWVESEVSVQILISMNVFNHSSVLFFTVLSCMCLFFFLSV